MEEQTQIFESYEAFKKREDHDVNGVSPHFANEYPEYAKENISNKSCWNCSDCRSCRSKEGNLVIPQIEKIHQKVLEAVSKPKALDMSCWHTCETTIAVQDG